MMIKIEQRFNRSAATSVEVSEPVITTGGGLHLGMKLSFQNAADGSHIAMHLTPDAAAKLGARLIKAATDAAA